MTKFSKAAFTASVLCVSMTSSTTLAWIPNSNMDVLSIRSQGNRSSQQLYARPSALVKSQSIADTVTATQQQQQAPTDISLPGGVSIPVPDPIQETISQILQTEKATEDAITNVEKSSASNLLDMFNSIDSIFSKLSDSIVSSIPKDQLSTIITNAIDAAKDNTKQVDDILLSNPMIGPFLSTIQNKLTFYSPILSKQILSSTGSLQPTVTLLVSAIVTYVITTSMLNMNAGPAPSSPYPLGRYDPKSARAYFDGRLNEVIGRGVEIASQSLVFGLALLSDKLK